MSNDSFNKPADNNPQLQPARTKPRLKKEWGILGGAVFGLLALIAPYFLLEPVFTEVIARLPTSGDLKVSVAQGLVAVLSVTLLAVTLAVYGKKFSDIGLNRARLAYAGHAVLGYGIYIVATIALAYLLNPPDQPQDIGYNTSLSTVELLFAGLILAVLVPLKEELIFRGFMYVGFRRRLPFWAAAIGVSVLFGLVHGQWNVGIDVFAMSMVSCYLVEKTGSLWPAIFLHIIKNGVAFCLIYLYNGG